MRSNSRDEKTILQSLKRENLRLRRELRQGNLRDSNNNLTTNLATPLGHYMTLREPSEDSSLVATRQTRFFESELIRMLDSAVLVTELVGKKEAEQIRKELFYDSNGSPNTYGRRCFVYTDPLYHDALKTLFNRYVDRAHTFCQIYTVDHLQGLLVSLMSGALKKRDELALVLAALALGAQTLHQEELGSLNEMHTIAKDGDIYETLASSVYYYMDQSDTTVEGLSALVMVQMAETFRSPLNSCSPNQLGVIVEMAYSLGLNRDSQKSTLTNEIRRRLWHTIVMLDYSLSSNTFRPGLTERSSWDVSHPVDIEGTRQIYGAILLFRSIAIESHVSKLITSNKMLSYDEVLAFDKRLQAALNDRDTSRYRLADDPFVVDSPADSRNLDHEMISYLIEFRIQHAIMLLHKPFYRAYSCKLFNACYNPRYEMSRDATIISARELISLTLALFNNKLLRDKFRFVTDSTCLFYGLDGMYSLAISISQATQRYATDQDLHNLGKLTDILRSLSDTSAVAKRGYLIMSYLSSLIIKRFPDYMVLLGYNDNMLPETNIDSIDLSELTTSPSDTFDFNGDDQAWMPMNSFDEISNFEAYYKWIVSNFEERTTGSR
jgi:hypothetical protein